MRKYILLGFLCSCSLVYADFAQFGAIDKANSGLDKEMQQAERIQNAPVATPKPVQNLNIPANVVNNLPPQNQPLTAEELKLQNALMEIENRSRMLKELEADKSKGIDKELDAKQKEFELKMKIEQAEQRYKDFQEEIAKKNGKSIEDEIQIQKNNNENSIGEFKEQYVIIPNLEYTYYIIGNNKYVDISSNKLQNYIAKLEDKKIKLKTYLMKKVHLDKVASIKDRDLKKQYLNNTGQAQNSMNQSMNTPNGQQNAPQPGGMGQVSNSIMLKIKEGDNIQYNYVVSELNENYIKLMFNKN